MFRLPFLEFVVGWMFAALLVVLIVTAVFHYLNGGIRLQSPWQRVTPQVKVHLSVILALMALTKTVQYYLARYELVFSRRGFVDGASYTDVHAQLPALNLLMVISIAAAALVHRQHLPQGLGVPDHRGRAVGVHLARGRHHLSRGHPALRRAAERVLAGTAVHRTQHRDDARRVRARQQEGRDPGLRLQHRSRPKPTSQTNQQTLNNIRLWDPAPTQEVFRAQQERFPYYRFIDVDADRYKVGADEQAAMVALARARRRQHPGPHVDEQAPRVHARVRTGGRGREPQQDGEPSYLVSDIPEQPVSSPTTHPTSPASTSARTCRGYAVVDTKVAEQQAATGDDHRGDAVPGRRGREDVELPAEERARPAVRRLEPLRVGPAHRRTRACSTSATSVSVSAPRHRS